MKTDTQEIPVKETLAQGLREVADLLDIHPSLADKLGAYQELSTWANSPSQLTELLRALADGGRVTKRSFGTEDQYIKLERTFPGGITFKIFTGKENAGCKKVTVMKKSEEWQCGPLLNHVQEEELC